MLNHLSIKCSILIQILTTSETLNHLFSIQNYISTTSEVLNHLSVKCSILIQILITNEMLNLLN